ncbi:hypothetical protein IW01_11600 [Pectobacterium brasiliense]|nr:hypothetical protein IW01_11600 [Pectobacterium brasiliense]GLY62816.1 hypothetical protein Pcaca05_36730 [Pectobacterium carotovorum subsp. carotovorum]
MPAAAVWNTGTIAGLRSEKGKEARQNLPTVGRTIGWIAHWDEMHKQDEISIYRPRQIYTGQPRRDYVSALKD